MNAAPAADEAESEEQKAVREVYITIAEAMELLGVTDARISQLCTSGKFPGAFRMGRTWLIPREAAERYVRQRRPRSSR